MTKHQETKFLPYSPDRLYDMVADIERYPEFIPWCQALRVRQRNVVEGQEIVDADMVVSFKVFRERFGSRVTLSPNEKNIEVEYLDGPFKYLKNTWGFEPVENGSNVHFFVDFEFKNVILQSTVGLVFGEAMQRIVGAFEHRAKELYD